jgi:hypothetical protein
MAALPMAGYSYTAAGSTVPSGRGPFDTVFWFNSTIDDFSVVLTADYPVTAGGSDPLVPGSGSGASLAGSFEYCTENATACAGPGFQDGRLVTAGTLYAPEPATFSLLGAGSVLLPLVRRKRAPAKRGAAAVTRRGLRLGDVAGGTRRRRSCAARGTGGAHRSRRRRRHGGRTRTGPVAAERLPLLRRLVALLVQPVDRRILRVGPFARRTGVVPHRRMMHRMAHRG